MAVMDDIASLKNSSFEELLDMLVDGGDVEQFGSIEAPKGERISIGLAIFKESLVKVKPYICARDGVVMKASESSEAAIIAGIADIVLDRCGGLPVSVLTLLILKYGIDRICDDE